MSDRELFKKKIKEKRFGAVKAVALHGWCLFQPKKGS